MADQTSQNKILKLVTLRSLHKHDSRLTRINCNGMSSQNSGVQGAINQINKMLTKIYQELSFIRSPKLS